MVHELLSKGERVQASFGENIKITDKRLIKTDRSTYFEDLDLNAIEAVELKISHYEVLLRIGSSLLIIYGLSLLLSTVEFLALLGIEFGVVSAVSLSTAIAFVVIYFILRRHVTKVYGNNKIMIIPGHDWDIVSTLRHHVFAKQEENMSGKGSIKKK